MILNLPLPPSANSLYANGKRGRYKTKKYKDWIAHADQYFLAQMRKLDTVTGACEVRIRVNDKMRGDVDNRIKAASDFLVSRHLTSDDRYTHKITISRDPNVKPHLCEVEFFPI